MRWMSDSVPARMMIGAFTSFAALNGSTHFFPGFAAHFTCPIAGKPLLQKSHNARRIGNLILMLKQIFPQLGGELKLLLSAHREQLRNGFGDHSLKQLGSMSFSTETILHASQQIRLGAIQRFAKPGEHFHTWVGGSCLYALKLPQCFSATSRSRRRWGVRVERRSFLASTRSPSVAPAGCPATTSRMASGPCGLVESVAGCGIIDRVAPGPFFTPSPLTWASLEPEWKVGMRHDRRSAGNPAVDAGKRRAR